jgi:hypothetical protein
LKYSRKELLRLNNLFLCISSGEAGHVSIMFQQLSKD